MRQSRSSPHQSSQPPSSSGTATNSRSPAIIVATLEHRRLGSSVTFVAGTDTSVSVKDRRAWERRSRQVAKSGWETVRETDRWSSVPLKGPIPDTILSTPSVVNTPRGIDADISRSRAMFRDLATRPERRKGRRKKSPARLIKETKSISGSTIGRRDHGQNFIRLMSSYLVSASNHSAGDRRGGPAAYGKSGASAFDL